MSKENDEQVHMIEHMIASANKLGDREEPIARIVQLFRIEDPRVRSRAARLVGRYINYRSFLERRLQDENPRARANAIESLWGNTSPHVVAALTQSVNDTNHRARTNAVLGLYHAGDKTHTYELLLEQSRHKTAAFRHSAAWGMGETLDQRFTEVLTQMAKDPDADVCRNAERSLVKLRKAAAEQAAAEQAVAAADSQPVADAPAPETADAVTETA